MLPLKSTVNLSFNNKEKNPVIKWHCFNNPHCFRVADVALLHTEKLHNKYCLVYLPPSHHQIITHFLLLLRRKKNVNFQVSQVLNYIPLQSSIRHKSEKVNLLYIWTAAQENIVI